MSLMKLRAAADERRTRSGRQREDTPGNAGKKTSLSLLLSISATDDHSLVSCHLAELLTPPHVTGKTAISWSSFKAAHANCPAT